MEDRRRIVDEDSSQHPLEKSGIATASINEKPENKVLQL